MRVQRNWPRLIAVRNVVMPTRDFSEASFKEYRAGSCSVMPSVYLLGFERFVARLLDSQEGPARGQQKVLARGSLVGRFVPGWS